MNTEKRQPRAYALVVAGGSGQRLGSDTPKQFLTLGGQEVLTYSLLALQRTANICGIVVCAQKMWHEHVRALCAENKITKFMDAAAAGADRRASVYSGLCALSARGIGEDDVVLVHDAARPFLTRRVIEDNIRVALEKGACCTVIPSTDTPLMSESGGAIDRTLPRRCVYLSQTPQSFRFGLIFAAHRQVPLDLADVTDDCALALADGHEVALVSGERELMKITHPQDMAIASVFLKAYSEE